MHSYMRAIGFSGISNEELDDLLYKIIKFPQIHQAAFNSEEVCYIEMRHEVCKNMGIAIRGIYNKDDTFKMDYYFPYYIGKKNSTNCDFEIIRQSDRESYQGWADDSRIGVSLIFNLDNIIDYLKSYKGRTRFEGENFRNIYLSGLSLEGKVLLPNCEVNPNYKNKNSSNRSNLVAKAREGDEEAIENLTLEDIDMYAMISRRITKEDIYSIVKTSFMPFGIESDKYSVIGIIKDIKEYINEYSQEEVYILTIETNDLPIEICINKDSLMGEPQVGRRFKGNIWLQGHVDF